MNVSIRCFAAYTRFPQNSQKTLNFLLIDLIRGMASSMPLLFVFIIDVEDDIFQRIQSSERVLCILRILRETKKGCVGNLTRISGKQKSLNIVEAFRVQNY
jgi:hypothetical protein